MRIAWKKKLQRPVLPVEIWSRPLVHICALQFTRLQGRDGETPILRHTRRWNLYAPGLSIIVLTRAFITRSTFHSNELVHLRTCKRLERHFGWPRIVTLWAHSRGVAPVSWGLRIPHPQNLPRNKKSLLFYPGTLDREFGTSPAQL